MDKQPTEGPELEVSFDELTRVLSVSIAHDPHFPRIDALWLRRRLEAAGYADLQIRPDPIRRLIAQYNAGEAVAPVEIAQCVDASMQIGVSLDGLVARLSIVPAKGGKPASKTELLALIESRGIVEGLLLEEMNRAIADGQADDLAIARGREPEPGKDGWLEYLLPETRERVPSVRPCGRTDYRDLGEILVVHAGDALMRRHPPQPGVDGVNVYGRPIVARRGREQRFAPGLRGTAISPEDPELLVAACDGQPVRVRNGAMVEPIFTVDAVNLATGNIDFDGSVRIRNDVQAGMTVRASGDIEVGGVVEPATLEAGGSIVVKGGVLGGLGGKTAGKDYSAHAIRCEGSFCATYAQQARISAGDSIFIDDVAMQCQLEARNHIRVGKRLRGQIVGGHCRASLSIHARTIGANSRIRTELEVGMDNGLEHAIQEKAEARDALENRLLEIGKMLTFADRHPDRVTPEMLGRAEQTASALSGEIESLRSEEEDLQHRLALTREARVNAEREMFEGCIVRMGEQLFKLSQDRGPTTVRLATQGLGVFPLEDDSRFDEPQRPAAASQGSSRR
ncbi:MAG TPA: FapA family protein [Thauera aminoaromatica]|nr:FapA family protein [Thauera aminoaromatica]